MAVQREAVGTPGAGRSVHDHGKDQVTVRMHKLAGVSPVLICMYVTVLVS